MKAHPLLLGAVAVVATGLTIVVWAHSEGSPIFGVTVPHGYRNWQLVAVAHRPDLDELHGILGNATAMKAYREGALPFPGGVVLAKLAWKHVPSAEVSAAFVPGQATTVQIMVKDSKKYAATGG